MTENSWHNSRRFSMTACLALACIAGTWTSASATDPYYRHGSSNYSHNSKYYQPSYTGRSYHGSDYHSAGKRYTQHGGKSHYPVHNGYIKSSTCKTHYGAYKSSYSQRVPHTSYSYKQKYSRGY